MMKRLLLLGLYCTFGVTLAAADRVEDIIAALSSEDGAVRRAAYTGIAAKEIPTYQIPAFAALLDNENPEIVRAASLALEGIVAPFTDAEGLREMVGEALCDSIDAVENDRWLFWLLSYTGEPNVVARVGAMFGEARFEDVVRVLEGIGGDAATNALVRQLTKSTADERVALIQALGGLGGETAIAALLNQAVQPDPVGLAAMYALGTIGTPRAGIIIEDRLGDTFSMPLLVAYLKIIETLPPNERVDVYENILISTEDPRAVNAALTGLAGTGTDAAIRALLKALYSDDPAIHGAARNGLIAIESGTPNRVLMAAIKTAGPDTKGVMLEILHERDPAAATPLLEKALTDADVQIRFQALTILGGAPDEKYEATFRQAAKTGPESVRPAALRAYLSLADHFEDEDKALSMYRDALGLATQNEERQRALKGMGRTGGVTTLAALRKYQDVPGIGDDISECAMAIADRLAESRPGIAKRVYEGVLQDGAIHLADRAVKGLRAMGIDKDFAKEAGYFTRWQLIGPFPNEGLGTPTPIETEFSKDTEYDGVDGKKVRWTNIRTPHIRGIVDLIGLIDPNQNTVAYARNEFTVEKGGDALLLVGSDDGIACWLNGEQVHANEVDRGLAIDSDRVPVKLNAGKNVLLLKISQHGGGWAFCARLTDPDRNPLPFTY